MYLLESEEVYDYFDQESRRKRRHVTYETGSCKTGGFYFLLEHSSLEPLSQHVKSSNAWWLPHCAEAHLCEEFNVGALVSGFTMSPAFESFQPRGQTQASGLSGSSQQRFRTL